MAGQHLQLVGLCAGKIDVDLDETVARLVAAIGELRGAHGSAFAASHPQARHAAPVRQQASVPHAPHSMPSADGRWRPGVRAKAENGALARLRGCR